MSKLLGIIDIPEQFDNIISTERNKISCNISVVTRNNNSRMYRSGEHSYIIELNSTCTQEDLAFQYLHEFMHIIQYEEKYSIIKPSSASVPSWECRIIENLRSFTLDVDVEKRLLFYKVNTSKYYTSEKFKGLAKQLKNQKIHRDKEIFIKIMSIECAYVYYFDSYKNYKELISLCNKLDSNISTICSNIIPVVNSYKECNADAYRKMLYKLIKLIDVNNSTFKII